MIRSIFAPLQKSKTSLAVLALAVWAVAVANLPAQQQPAQQPPAQQPPAEPQPEIPPDAQPQPDAPFLVEPPPAVPPVPTDPTRPSPQLQRALEAETPPPPPAARETPGQIPNFRLRGRMVLNSVTTAMLEMDGEIYRVAEGDEFTIRSPGGVVATFEVAELNARTIRLRIPPISDLITLP